MQSVTTDIDYSLTEAQKAHFLEVSHQVSGDMSAYRDVLEAQYNYVRNLNVC